MQAFGSDMLKPCTGSMPGKTGLARFQAIVGQLEGTPSFPDPSQAARSCSQRGHAADDCDPICRLYALSCSERGFGRSAPV